MRVKCEWPKARWHLFLHEQPDHANVPLSHGVGEWRAAEAIADRQVTHALQELRDDSHVTFRGRDIYGSI